MIEFINEDIQKISIDNTKVADWIEQVVTKDRKILGDVCFIFCSDNYLLNINNEYLKHNYFTDVITFDYSDNIILSGDIFISIDRVKENSNDLSISFNNELLRIIIHGVLHLIGYNDKSDKEKLLMTSMEDESLKLYSDVE